MFAAIAAVLIFLVAIGVSADAVDLFLLGLAFLALHFAWDFSPWHR
jgi:hypothetical protein